MAGMRLPLLGVLRRQRFIPSDLDVLRMLVLGGLRVIERATDDDLPVDAGDFTMRNSVLGIDQGGNARVRQKVGRGVFIRAIDLSRMASTHTPRSLASTRALAMGVKVKL
jgi:hypothetical protein